MSRARRGNFGGVGREIDRCLAELHRLQRLGHAKIPVATAAGASAIVAGLGNGVVLLGRRWCEEEWITLIAVPVIGVAGMSLLRRRGWSWRDLGFRPLVVQSSARLASALVLAATCLAAVSGVVAFLSRELTALEVVRTLVGTAVGEEIVHRSVVLAAWVDTRLRAGWVVAANMITFAVWHVAGANAGRFSWIEVIGPGLLALPLLWARLRFHSVLAPAAFHGAANLTGSLLATGSAELRFGHCVTGR
ncbi:MAG TPA: CPBP family glutamic-type intramembrane protease [Thermomicrobiales bacterium]|nr:CPBP family glutamic-type intramembrane protease [Thermomicrobiales bacterium]